jgi:site-specific recombinase XerD
MDRWKIFDPAIWNTVHASIAPSTEKRYRGIFTLFQNYLSDVGRSLQNMEREDVLSFFQDYVDDRKAASTIRSVYSALLFHFRLHGVESFLTSNPIVQMFVDGAQRLAPPPTRKVVIWDPEIPLSFLQNRPRPSDFRPAGQEALLLLLLATGIRVDCASKLSHKIVKRTTFGQIEFLLPRKTGNSNPQVIKCFLKDPRLCPLMAIEHFLSVGKSIRKPNEPFLFISSKGTRAHIDTLRHWVNDLLNECGIVATAGSCRSASSSAAVARDVDIDTVLKAAGWKRESTFRRYYQRQVVKANEGYNLFDAFSDVVT